MWIDPSRFVGIPFADLGRTWDGCDCWGLFRLVQKELFGRSLPSYTDYDVATNKQVVNALVTSHGLESGDWIPVHPKKVAIGDGVLLRRAGEYHIGVVVDASRTRMLHTEMKTGSLIEDYSSLKFKHSLVGFYRYWRGETGETVELGKGRHERT